MDTNVMVHELSLLLLELNFAVLECITDPFTNGWVLVHRLKHGNWSVLLLQVERKWGVCTVGDMLCGRSFCPLATLFSAQNTMAFITLLGNDSNAFQTVSVW